MVFRPFKPILVKAAPLLLSVGLAMTASSSHAQGRLYRYVNEEGTQVLSNSIPPKYVKRGYEVLSPKGRVLQVIPPEPDPEDKARVEKEKALLAKYEMLAKRYSSAADIESARVRRMGRIEANIAVLRANINNLTSQIEDLMSDAAGFERAGTKVPNHIFTSIDELRSEIKNTEATLALRLAEHKEINNKFDEDIALFEKGKALLLNRQTVQAGQ